MLAIFLMFIFGFTAVNSVGNLNGIVNERDALLQYLRTGALSPPPGLDNLSTASIANLLNMSGVLENGRHDWKPQSFTPNGHPQSSVSETEALLSALAGTQTNEALSLLLQNSLRGQLTSALMKASETPLVQVGQGTSNCALPVATPSASISNNMHAHGNAGPRLSQAHLMAARPLPVQSLASSSISNGMHHPLMGENSVKRVDQFQGQLLQGQVTPLATAQKFFPPAQPTEARRSNGHVQFARNVEDGRATESTSDLEAPPSMMSFLGGQDVRTVQDVVSHHSRPAIDLQQPPLQYEINEGSPSGSDQSPSSSNADWKVFRLPETRKLAPPVL